LLYQGALNIGRGLDWVIDAMPFLKENCVLLIIGDGDIKAQLCRKVKQLALEDCIFFCDKMPPEELCRYTKAADIGLCLLENKGLSYYYSLPNRIFDFIQAGVPVLATNFPEIGSIVEGYGTGVVINHYEPEYLSRIIATMLVEGKKTYTERLRALSSEFCWEKEEKKLLEIFKNKANR
jgi:glycosyltransferase involved in cell wall biosynthesis